MTDTVLAGRIGSLSTRSNGETRTVVRMSGEGAILADNAGGRYLERTYRGDVYFASAAAVTLPVNANNLVSLFGLYNPPSSGVLLEIIDVEAHYVVATTVVNALGVYSSTAALSAAATFTTAGTARSRRVQDGASNAARFYTAVTHSGTPSLEAIVGGWGAVTDGGSTPIRKEFNGSLIVPQGILISLAMTTAAATASGVTLGMTWAEIPV